MANGDESTVWEVLRRIEADVSSIKTDVAVIKESDRHLPCEAHRAELGEVKTALDRLRDRVNSGLTMKAVLMSVLSAAAAAIITGTLIWNRVSQAVAAISGGK